MDDSIISSHEVQKECKKVVNHKKTAVFLQVYYIRFPIFFHHQRGIRLAVMNKITILLNSEDLTHTFIKSRILYQKKKNWIP